MPRRITPSQFRSRIRQAEAKRRQAVQKLNREIRQHNQKVKRVVDQYNRDVRSYNAKVRANKARIQRALQQLSRLQVTTRYAVLHTSVRTLNEAYVRLQQQSRTAALGADYDTLIGYAEQENANSLDVTNALLGGPAEEEPREDDLAGTAITSELRQISTDLDRRWHGAVYSLSRRNPDAARHFCTSSREIITTILDVKALDAEVVALMPDCDKTPEGAPTRRARIHYCLQRKGLADQALETFVEEDINNIIELFKVLSAGTHGPAGKYGLTELFPLKQRVEDAIFFLAKIVD